MEETKWRAYQAGLIKHPLGRPLTRLAAVRRGRGQNSSGFLSGLDHHATGLYGDAERLFAEYMQAGLHTVHGNTVVETVRKAQVGGVYVCQSKQILVGNEDFRPQSEQLFKHIGPLFGRLLIGIANGADDEVTATTLLKILHGQHMAARNPAAAD